MQKYKQKNDSQSNQKPTKKHLITSVTSNKQLLSKPTNSNHNKSSSSGVGTIEPIKVKSNNKIKPPKNQSNTFTNNTHQNSINIISNTFLINNPSQNLSNIPSHNNSKSQHKKSNITQNSKNKSNNSNKHQNKKQSHSKTISSSTNIMKGSHKNANSLNLIADNQGNSTHLLLQPKFLTNESDKLLQKKQIIKNYKNVLKNRQTTTKQNICLNKDTSNQVIYFNHKEIKKKAPHNTKSTNQLIKQIYYQKKPNQYSKSRSKSNLQSFITKKSGSKKVLLTEQSQGNAVNHNGSLNKISYYNKSTSNHNINIHPLDKKQTKAYILNKDSIFIVNKNSKKQQKSSLNLVSQSSVNITSQSKSRSKSRRKQNKNSFKNRNKQNLLSLNNMSKPFNLLTDIAQVQSYENIPIQIFKSTTNSDIQFSNIDQNTVHSHMRNYQNNNGNNISSQYNFNYEEGEMFGNRKKGRRSFNNYNEYDKNNQYDKYNQDQQVGDQKGFLKEYNKNEEINSNVSLKNRTQQSSQQSEQFQFKQYLNAKNKQPNNKGKNGKKQHPAKSKKHNKMNLQLQTVYMNCLTEPQYTVQPKGIKHKNTFYRETTQRDQLSSSFNSQIQYQYKQNSKKSKPTYPKINQQAIIPYFSISPSNIKRQQLKQYNEYATRIQKVFKGYMTRKLFAHYIQEYEHRLEQKMKQIEQGRMNNFIYQEDSLDESEIQGYNDNQIMVSNMKDKEPQQYQQNRLMKQYQTIDYEDELENSNSDNQGSYQQRLKNNSELQGVQQIEWVKQKRIINRSNNYFSDIKSNEQRQKGRQSQSSGQNKSKQVANIHNVNKFTKEISSSSKNKINNSSSSYRREQSFNPLDYQSSIMPRQQQQTISFLNQINNVQSCQEQHQQDQQEKHKYMDQGRQSENYSFHGQSSYIDENSFQDKRNSNDNRNNYSNSNSNMYEHSNKYNNSNKYENNRKLLQLLKKHGYNSFSQNDNSNYSRSNATGYKNNGNYTNKQSVKPSKNQQNQILYTSIDSIQHLSKVQNVYQDQNVFIFDNNSQYDLSRANQQNQQYGNSQDQMIVNNGQLSQDNNQNGSCIDISSNNPHDRRDINRYNYNDKHQQQQFQQRHNRQDLQQQSSKSFQQYQNSYCGGQDQNNEISNKQQKKNGAASKKAKQLNNQNSNYSYNNADNSNTIDLQQSVSNQYQTQSIQKIKSRKFNVNDKIFKVSSNRLMINCNIPKINDPSKNEQFSSEHQQQQSSSYKVQQIYSNKQQPSLKQQLTQLQQSSYKLQNQSSYKLQSQSSYKVEQEQSKEKLQQSKDKQSLSYQANGCVNIDSSYDHFQDKRCQFSNNADQFNISNKVIKSGQPHPNNQADQSYRVDSSDHSNAIINHNNQNNDRSNNSQIDHSKSYQIDQSNSYQIDHSRSYQLNDTEEQLQQYQKKQQLQQQNKQLTQQQHKYQQRQQYQFSPNIQQQPLSYEGQNQMQQQLEKSLELPDQPSIIVQNTSRVIIVENKSKNGIIDNKLVGVNNNYHSRIENKELTKDINGQQRASNQKINQQQINHPQSSSSYVVDQQSSYVVDSSASYVVDQPSSKIINQQSNQQQDYKEQSQQQCRLNININTDVNTDDRIIQSNQGQRQNYENVNFNNKMTGQNLHDRQYLYSRQNEQQDKQVSGAKQFDGGKYSCMDEGGVLLNKQFKQPLQKQQQRLQEQQNQFLQQLNSEMNQLTGYNGNQSQQLNEGQQQYQNKKKPTITISSTFYPNKSNPHILLIKSPKNERSFNKTYFHKSSQKVYHKHQSQQNKLQTYPKNKLSKTQSLKNYFFKKDFFHEQVVQQDEKGNNNDKFVYNNNSNDYDSKCNFIKKKGYKQIPSPKSIANYQYKSVKGNNAFNDQFYYTLSNINQHQRNHIDQINSIEKLLSFRHNLVNHRHGKQLQQLKLLYQQQKISKQQFIQRLQKISSSFQEQQNSIKRKQNDIFKGYKALMQLIKDVIRDCKTLNFSQQNGTNVRFCKSMEIFFNGSNKITESQSYNNKKEIPGNQNNKEFYWWKFDDVMIDQLQKSRKRRLTKNNLFQRQQKPEIQDKEQKEQKPFSSSPAIHIQEEVNQKAQIHDQIQLQGQNQQKSSIKQLKVQTLSHEPYKNIPTTAQIPNQKQLSRHSLSHTRLPQFKQIQKTTEQINKSVQKGQQKQEQRQKSLSGGSRKIKSIKVVDKVEYSQPCSFDISDLGICDDQYTDEQDEVSLSREDLQKQVKQAVIKQVSNVVQKGQAIQQAQAKDDKHQQSPIPESILQVQNQQFSHQQTNKQLRRPQQQLSQEQKKQTINHNCEVNNISQTINLSDIHVEVKAKTFQGQINSHLERENKFQSIIDNNHTFIDSQNNIKVPSRQQYSDKGNKQDLYEQAVKYISEEQNQQLGKQIIELLSDKNISASNDGANTVNKRDNRKLLLMDQCIVENQSSKDLNIIVQTASPFKTKQQRSDQLQPSLQIINTPAKIDNYKAWSDSIYCQTFNSHISNQYHQDEHQRQQYNSYEQQAQHTVSYTNIKRQVYQLQLDGDSSSGEEEDLMAKQQNGKSDQEQTHKQQYAYDDHRNTYSSSDSHNTIVDNNKGYDSKLDRLPKKLQNPPISTTIFTRSNPQSKLREKYFQTAQILYNYLIWEFMEQIIVNRNNMTINKTNHLNQCSNENSQNNDSQQNQFNNGFENSSMNRRQNIAKSTSMGKRLCDMAKKLSEINQQDDNVMIISRNTLAGNTRTHTRVNKFNPYFNQEQNKRNGNLLTKVNHEEIRLFLDLLYKCMPTFQNNKEKLNQRMYPNPLELLESLRDSSMEDYFGSTPVSLNRAENNSLQSSLSSQRHSLNANQISVMQPSQPLPSCHYDKNNSAQKQQQFSDNKLKKSSKQQSSSQQSSSELIKQQASYLQLGSYQFLLSQQFCEELIQKFIAEIYDPIQERLIKEREQSDEEKTKMTTQFNNYMENKEIILAASLNSVVSTRNIKKNSQFLSFIRTKQLFHEHKIKQSLMLRRQIIKIELHTILDSINQELIKQRQSKYGYSGLGLNELGMGVRNRQGLKVLNEQQYNMLINRGKYRIQKFIINQQVQTNDKLLLQCQQTITLNDSQWIFYVTQALEFALQINKIVEEEIWEQLCQEYYQMMMKRKVFYEPVQLGYVKLQDYSNGQQQVQLQQLIKKNDDNMPLQKKDNDLQIQDNRLNDNVEISHGVNYCIKDRQKSNYQIIQKDQQINSQNSLQQKGQNNQSRQYSGFQQTQGQIKQFENASEASSGSYQLDDQLDKQLQRMDGGQF